MFDSEALNIAKKYNIDLSKIETKHTREEDIIDFAGNDWAFQTFKQSAGVKMAIKKYY